MERMKTLQKDAPEEFHKHIFQEIKDFEEQRFKEEMDLTEKKHRREREKKERERAKVERGEREAWGERWRYQYRKWNQESRHEG